MKEIPSVMFVSFWVAGQLGTGTFLKNILYIWFKVLGTNRYPVYNLYVGVDVVLIVKLPAM